MIYPGNIAEFDIEILATATAVPANVVSQAVTHEHVAQEYPDLAHMEALYTNTGIEKRYFCEPIDWYHQPHSWEERTEKFHHHALNLLEDAASKAVAEAGLTLEEIDILVVNTITGLAIPSLDAKLMNRMDFRRDVERLPIFGFGCGGGVAGLGLTARLAQARPGSVALFLTVDLCSLCMRTNDKSVAMFVSAALFGDGAAAVVLRNTASDDWGVEIGQSGSGSCSNCRLIATGQHCWPETEHIMGWDIKDDGFGVVLSPELPALMQKSLRDAIDQFCNVSDLAPDGFSGFLFHPGGRKVLETAEQILGIERAKIETSWDILRNFGNMSSVTALFILDKALRDGAKGRQLLAAFGPGFSAYFVALEMPQ